MKCKACGYEREVDYSEQPTKYTGDEDFIRIIGSFHVKNAEWHGGEHTVSLLACPKCNTVVLYD